MIVQTFFKMKIIISTAILLNIFFKLSTVASQDTSAEVLCQFQGRSSNNGYQFDKDDVHKSCSSVIYSYYYVDGTWQDYHIFQWDITVIKSLVDDDKVVYVMIGFLETEGWLNVFYPPDQNQFTTFRDGLIRFLNEYKIAGIILDRPNIYIGQPDLAEKINSFASEIKSCLNDLKIGIVIDGVDYQNFSKPDAFNFATTNINLDLYIIDTTKANECNQETKITGVVPITSDNCNLISLEQMLTAAYCSSMDKQKLYAKLDLSVRRTISFGSTLPPISHSEYCCGTQQSFLSQCCVDNSTMLYEKGKYVRQLQYQGIMLSVEEQDDYDETCNCEKFPVTNRIIAGWENLPLQPCSKLDQL